MELVKSNFNNCSQGPVDKSLLKTAFEGGKVFILMGRLEQLLLFIGLKKPYSFIAKKGVEKVLKVIFPASVVGPLPGCIWKIGFRGQESANLKYHLFVPSDFDFAKGGKLPGLAGGEGNSGGEVPNGRDGWSVRFMFQENGRLCAYIYYPDMQQKYGEKHFLIENEACYILPKGEWVEIGLKIRLNNPGKRDGNLQCFINDKMMLNLDQLNFRSVDTLKIDQLLFSTFFGGADLSYAPAKNCELFFKNFQVTKPVNSCNE